MIFEITNSKCEYAIAVKQAIRKIVCSPHFIFAIFIIGNLEKLAGCFAALSQFFEVTLKTRCFSPCNFKAKNSSAPKIKINFLVFRGAL